MSRSLRSKIKRAALWKEANGKCEMCGEPLHPDNWHADHIIPFKVTGKTNVNEMQALCPRCNLLKGDKMLRLHQKAMIEICDGILAGENTKEIIAYITPGGGKSALPVILAHKLIPQKADLICWVVPRDSLQKQGQMAFTDTLFRLPQVLGHNYLIRQSTNDINPSRDNQGHITTYQAVVSGSGILRDDFLRKRYILFLDEPHHIAVGSSFARAVQPLVENAVLTVFASGTLERGDRKQIAFLPYVDTPMGAVIDTTETPTRKVIRYTRRTALEEKAIIPLDFEVHDSRAEWVDTEGQRQAIDSFSDYDVDGRAALRTVLRTEFAYELIEKCLDHWKGHKNFVYRDAKMLVVAPEIITAKKYQTHLKSLGVNSAIATSDNEKQARANIDRFKKSLDVLVTVAMAYEGLDVKPVTHIACLTHFRSKPWLEQCFDRANRTAKGKQRGFIFAPDDPDFRMVMENIRIEQVAAAKMLEEREANREADQPILKGDILPQGSQMTDSRAYDGATGKYVPADQYKVIEIARENAGLPPGLSITQLNNFLIEAGLVSLKNTDREPNVHAPLATPQEQEDNLLSSIETYARKVDKGFFNCTWGTTNKELYGVFGKARKEMTIEELQHVWRYLQHQYPMAGEDDKANH